MAQPLVRDVPADFVMVRTAAGGHVGFHEGPLGAQSFMQRVTLDFFDAVREEAA